MAKETKELKIVKQLPNGSALFSNGMVRTPVCRISFVNFSQPKKNQNDDGSEKESYGCAALFARKENLTLITMACENFLKQEKGTATKGFKKSPLRLQDDKVDDYDGFVAGAFYMNTSTKFKPRVTGRNKEDIDVSSFYSGCYVRLTLRPYLYDAKGNKGVGLGIAGVQFIRDGEPLGGGGVDPNDIFDSEEDDDIGDADALL